MNAGTLPFFVAAWSLSTAAVLPTLLVPRGLVARQRIFDSRH
jgi:hypothetical protein